MLLVALAGCEKKPAKFEGPMPIAYGDCAGDTVRFVSGPLPQAFGTGPAAAAPTADAPKPDGDNFDSLLAPLPGEVGGGFGFGRSGFGPSGGTGWGTIGTGRYGTIGHGGYGVGRGGMRGRVANVPTVSIGQPNAQGDLDKAIIRRYIKRNINKIQYCYEKQLLSKPKIEGTIQTQFMISPSGSVSAADAQGFDTDVATCVRDVIKSIEFPKPKGGGMVQVNYPFTFRHNDSAATIAVAPAEPPPPPPPAAPTSSAPSLDGKQLYRPGRAKAYEPGTDNPLRLERDALTACLRGNPAHFGAAVVELHYGNGAVTSAVVHGLTDDPTRDCIAEAAKHAIQPKGTPAVQRCAFAFGEQPSTELTTLALTKTGAQLAGKPVALDKLMAELDGAVKAVVTSTAVVSVHNPISLQVDPATPMKLVAQAWGAILGADDDFVFAGLQPITLPSPPVPLSSGGHRARIKSTQGHGSDERVVLSISVTHDKVWLGVSRVNELVETTLDGLEAKLKEYKASAFFADRTDLEIAGDDDVTFAEVKRAIDAATTAGFGDWTLARPDELAAKPSL